jgi:hypothetical protein
MVRAMDARSIKAHVKRARFAFTCLSLLRKNRITIPTGNRAVSGERSLVLRPRLTTGLPWTAFG